MCVFRGRGVRRSLGFTSQTRFPASIPMPHTHTYTCLSKGDQDGKKEGKRSQKERLKSVWKVVLLSNSVVSNSLRPLVLHHLPELAQIHVHWVGDTIQPSYLVIPFSFFLSQHQGFSQCAGFSHQVAKVLELQQLYFQSRLISLRIDWFDLLAV